MSDNNSLIWIKRDINDIRDNLTIIQAQVGSLNANDHSTFNSNLTIHGDLSANTASIGQLTIRDSANMEGDFDIKGNATVRSSLNIHGDLNVFGLTTNIETTTLTVDDPVIYVAQNNTSNVVDIGLVGKYVDSGISHVTGLVKGTDNKWNLFDISNETVSTINSINKTNPNYNVATLIANIEAINLSVSNTTTISNTLVLNDISTNDDSLNIERTGNSDSSVLNLIASTESPEINFTNTNGTILGTIAVSSSGINIDSNSNNINLDNNVTINDTRVSIIRDVSMNNKQIKHII